METLRKTAEQFRDLYQSMTASQRGTLVVVPLLVLAALGLLMYTGGGSRSDEYLLGGKFFSPEELVQTQQALRDAGLTDFRQEGQRLAVARKDVDKYTAALVSQRSLPSDFARDFDRMMSKINAFTTETHRREISDETRKMRMGKILKAMPDVEDAFVEWERPKQQGFQRAVTATATVGVKLRSGQALSSPFVQSLKTFAASALTGIGKDQVTVVDLNSGHVTGPSKPEDAHINEVLQLERQRALDYESKIAQALHFIPNVTVAVNVDLEPIRSKTQRETTLQTKAFPLETKKETRTVQSSNKKAREQPGVKPNQPGNVAAAAGNEETEAIEESREQETNLPSHSVVETTSEGHMPKSVKVAVSIPEDYYQSVADARGLKASDSADENRKQLDAIRAEIEKNVQAIVLPLIPTGSTLEHVKVTSWVRPKTEIKTVTTPIMTRVSDVVSQWGSTIMLGIFALIALRMLSRSAPNPAPVEARREGPSSGSQADEDEDDEEAANRPAPPPTKRDELQVLVRDNPEMAAALLNRWITNVK